MFLIVIQFLFVKYEVGEVLDGNLVEDFMVFLRDMTFQPCAPMASCSGYVIFSLYGLVEESIKCESELNDLAIKFGLSSRGPLHSYAAPMDVHTMSGLSSTRHSHVW